MLCAPTKKKDNLRKAVEASLCRLAKMQNIKPKDYREMYKTKLNIEHLSLLSESYYKDLLFDLDIRIKGNMPIEE